jgi:sulfur carrier protein ThiS
LCRIYGTRNTLSNILGCAQKNALPQSPMKLYAGGLLDFYLPGHRSRMEIELQTPTRLSEIITGLGIPLPEVHLVVVNGKLVELNDALISNADEVKLYPAVNGG